MKKKLVYILHDIKIGGVEVALVSAVPDLTEVFDLKIVVLGEIDLNLLKDLNQSQKNVFVAFHYPVYHYPFVILKICRHILDFKPDLIVASLWRASIVGVLIKKIRPSVNFFCFIHNTTFFHKPDAYFSKTAIRVADTVFVDSEAAVEFVKKITTSDKPIKQISMLTSRAHRMYKDRVLDKEEIKFFFLGRIHTQKNLSLTVDLLYQLRLQNINATLDIYGRDAGDLSVVKNLVETLQLEHVIRFCGEVVSSDKWALYSKYDFYIQLSSVEGMAMSVAEAMQNGLVCIVTPVGEIPNYSSHMHSAILFQADQPRKSIDEINSVIADPGLYNRIALNAYQTFQNKELYSQSLIRNIMNNDAG